MVLPEKLDAYMQWRGVDYDLLQHSVTGSLDEAAEACKLDPDKLIRAVMLEDAEGSILAIMRADQMIDFRALNRFLDRNLTPASSRRQQTVFDDCEPGSTPPVGGAYGLQVIVDRSIDDLERVFFEPGRHDCLVGISGSDFSALQNGATRTDFATGSDSLETDSGLEFTMPSGIFKIEQLSRLRPAGEILHAVADTERLPAMPKMARDLLALRADARATVSQLGSIVSHDPVLSAQIVRYARSAFFGYRGEVDSVETAISRVLGFDAVLNLALGLATGRTLRYQATGHLSLNNLWRDSIYCAALTQALAGSMKLSLRPKPGTAYLAGLLHNFGYFALGHLFPPEMFLLNRLLGANRDVPVVVVEKRVLGVTHAEIGANLLQAWNLPEEVVVTQREHHNEYYRGDHAAYANLVLLSSYLMSQRGIGINTGVEVPPVVYTALGLSRELVEEAADRICESGENLDTMAKEMAAAT